MRNRTRLTGHLAFLFDKWKARSNFPFMKISSTAVNEKNVLVNDDNYIELLQHHLMILGGKDFPNNNRKEPARLVLAHKIIDCYNSNKRAFHTKSHLLDVWKNYVTIKNILKKQSQYIAPIGESVIFVAIAGHDIIHDFGQTKDLEEPCEYRSGDEMEYRLLKIGVCSQHAASVNACICATHIDTEPQGLIEKVVRDADLMCLARSQKVFDQGTELLRQEALKNGQTQVAFVKGMRWFLGEKIAHMRSLFYIDEIEKWFRPKVEKNITRCLNTLKP